MIVSLLQNKNDGMFHVSQLRVFDIFKEDGRITRFSKGPQTFSMSLVAHDKTHYFDFHSAEYRDQVVNNLPTHPYLNTIILQEQLIEDDIAMGMLELMVSDKKFLGKNMLLRASKYAGLPVENLEVFRYHKGRLQLDLPYLKRMAPEPDKFIRDCACTLLLPKTFRERQITSLQFYKFMTT